MSEEMTGLTGPFYVPGLLDLSLESPNPVFVRKGVYQVAIVFDGSLEFCEAFFTLVSEVAQSLFISQSGLFVGIASVEKLPFQSLFEVSQALVKPVLSVQILL